VQSEFDHIPVLLAESLEQLRLRSGGVIVDGTLGGGGHAAGILEGTAPDGVLIGLDLDEDALAAARERLAAAGDRLHLVHTSFRELQRVLDDLGIESLDGVLLDLGVSSHQLDTADRGFRFADAAERDTPLDMRMDASGDSPSAAELLRRASAPELQHWFQVYGELPGAKRLARAIVERREQAPIESTRDLLDVIRQAGIGRGRRHNPATLVFQALRIAVNDELGALEQGLAAAIERLRPGGRIVVIAYHSLEDRIVKHCFRAEARGCVCPPRQPVCTCGHKPRLRVVTRKPVSPSATETSRNPRARSARLRSAERLQQEAA
jgi:16S rRNA (cytosine1402-N4)-methyltransferase